jgi:hypothetical protein
MSKIPLLLSSLCVFLSACIVVPAHRIDDYEYATQLEPPSAQVEVIGVAPSPNQIWISGYWDWSNGRYNWTRGHWENARAHQVWHPHTWERQGNYWHMHKGYWGR